MKTIFSFAEANIGLKQFKNKALEWSSSFANVAYYDNNEHSNNKYGRFESLIALSNDAEIRLKSGADAWTNFSEFQKKYPNQWMFGYFAYDLKNELEKLQSHNEDFQKAAELIFFIPEILILISKDSKYIEISAQNPELVFRSILNANETQASAPAYLDEIKQRIPKDEYLQAVEQIRDHIIAGDLYEMNFCQEFYSEMAELNPHQFFASLNSFSPAPFSAWFKSAEQHIFCASPERFLFKQDNTVVSQPIKGTIKRGTDSKDDLEMKAELFNSEKDRAENVMIVDLVRNDLSRSAEIGSVKVDELFGIYGFRQVWQMISTISCSVSAEREVLDVIKAAFPPGSMTGAPKVMSMELIEHYEQSKRGPYSGTLGYFSPEGDFDFNVLIRSVFYNESSKRLSFQTGGAIVYDSDPEKEYEECLLKAKAMLMALDTNIRPC